MGSVLQLPVGKTRTAVLQRIRAANEPDEQPTLPAASEQPEGARRSRLARGAARVFAAVLRYSASLVVGMIAMLLSWFYRPITVLLSLAGLALLAALFMCGFKGWPDPAFATKIAIGLTIDLAVLVLLTRFLQSLFRLEHRLKGRN